MQLILLRHVEAEPYRQHDATRQLTERGQAQADWMARHLLSRVRPTRLCVSPLIRAKQTLEPLRLALPDIPCTVLDVLKPDDDPQVAIEQLSTYTDGCVLVVCHMNIIASMAALMVDDDPESFELAEARCFETALILPSLATERWRLLPPRQMDV